MTTSRIPFDKTALPLIFSINLAGVRYKMQLTYNEYDDGIYCTLINPATDEPLISEKVILGQPLFTCWVSESKPNVIISAFDPSDKAERMSFENLNNKIYLRITPKSDLIEA